MRRRDAYLERLAQVPMFSACSKRDLRMIAKAAEDHWTEPGDVLVREGRPGHEFFVIVDGEAVVSRDGAEVARLGPGDFFGELALLDRAPRDSTVTAATAMKVFVLHERDFHGLLGEIPLLSRKVLTGMARRLHEADAQPVA